MRRRSNGRRTETCYKRSMGRPRVTRGITSLAVAAFVCAALGCAGQAGKAPASAATALSTASAAASAGEVFTFPELIASPLDISSVPRRLAPFLAACKRGDAALSRVAERLARRQSEADAPLDVSELGFALRAEGSPYVWPRAWTLENGDLESPETFARMKGWLESFHDGGERRCGAAFAEGSERSVLAVVAVDALADLDPLAIRAREGAWVEVGATLLVPTSDAKIIVLGPSGAPYAVPTELDGRRARARFRADRSGPFLVQVLANVAGGPRPVLEATVYAGVSPPTSFFGDAAPGEPSRPPSPAADLHQELLSMINRARRAEQRPALARDATLDAIAQQHAEAMRDLKRIAHDSGDGLPSARIEAAGVSVLAAGENVAHALDITRAHRALWASPSHRENLLQPRFDTVGIGVAVDPDGSVWVCEVFADLPDQP